MNIMDQNMVVVGREVMNILALYLYTVLKNGDTDIRYFFVCQVRDPFVAVIAHLIIETCVLVRVCP